MEGIIARGGRFSFIIGTELLSRGLRKSAKNPRNNDFLVECEGAVVTDGVLHSMESLTKLATEVITDGFPYPQIFILGNAIIVCGSTKIYELVGNDLVLRHTASEAGSMWDVVDFFNFIYMSNRVVAVVRDSQSMEFSETTDYPVTGTMCNFNGQVLIGSRAQ